MSLGLSLSFRICEWEQGKKMINSYLLASSEFFAKDWKAIGLRSNSIDFRPWFSYSFVATLTSFLQLKITNPYGFQIFLNSKAHRYEERKKLRDSTLKSLVTIE